MKFPLNYQRTEYDCGPTAFMNAVNFLFEREQIPPDILRYVTTYTLDSYNDKGEAYKEGTSQMAMSFLAGWLNQYAKATKFPITCEYIGDERVQIGDGSRIVDALKRNGAVVIRLYLGSPHYVTLTGIEGDSVLMFDPYYVAEPQPHIGVEVIDDKPFLANRKVAFERLENTDSSLYSLGEYDTRAAVVIFNNATHITAEKTIEYFI